MSNYNPAPTFKILDYSNTWGNLLTTTNYLVLQNNDLASNNFFKATGTMYLEDPTLGLQVNSAAIFSGAFQSIGTGSSATIQNNLTVGGQVYLNYSSVGPSLTVAGQANVSGPILALGSGTGLTVANTANINGKLFVSNTSSFANAVSIYGQTYISSNVTVTGTTVTNQLQANTGIAAGALNVTNTTNTNILQANTSVNTAVITVTGTIFTNQLQANSGISSAALNVVNTTNTNILQANTSVNTATLTVTGQIYTNTLQANTGVAARALNVINTTNTNILQANTSVNTATLTVTGKTFTNELQANNNIFSSNVYSNLVQANTQIQTLNLNVIGYQNVDSITANTRITTPSIVIPSNGLIDASSSGSVISANGLSVGTAGLNVLGNFTINGTTVYNTPSFILSAGNPNPALVLNPGFGIYRTSANAIIRWNETNKFWDMNDVVNGNYYRVITDEYKSDSLTLASSSNVASSLAANTLNTNLNAANTFLQANINFGLSNAKAYTDTANNYLQANINFGLASSKTYTDTANTFLQANVISGVASAKVYTDVANTYISTNLNTANTFLQANVISGVASAKVYTDVANSYYNVVTSNINAYAQSGYARANTSSNLFNGTGGSASPSSGTVTLTSTNGVTITGSGSTLTFNTPQDLRTTATVTFTDIYAIRPGSSAGTGVVFLGNQGSGARYVYYDGTNYQMPGTNLYINSGLALTTSNYNTYAPTLTGTGASGTWNINISGNAVTTSQVTWSNLYTTAQLNSQGNQTGSILTATGSLGGIMVQGPGSSGSAFMSFLRPGIYASYFGLDTDNQFTVGGWSAGAALGNMKVGSLGIGGAASGTAGSITATGAISSASTITAVTFSGAGTSLTGTASSLTTGKASTLASGGGSGSAMTFNWAGQGGQPTWLWGGNDGTNMYVYNPSNFSVNFANYLSGIEQQNVILGKHQSMGMVGDGSQGSFTCRASGAGDSNLAGVTFWNDAYAIKMGIRADGYFGLGGWSRAAWSWYSDPSGNMVAAGNVTAYSDPRLKENFQPILSPVQQISKLNGVYFDWKQGIKHTECKAGKRDMGVLANEVEEVFPEIVSESISLDGDTYKMVAYEKLVPVLIEAIKELSNEINILKGKIGE